MRNIIQDWMTRLLVSCGLTLDQAHSGDQWVILGLIVLIAVLTDVLSRIFLLKVVRRIVVRTAVAWDDIIFNEQVLRRVPYHYSGNDLHIAAACLFGNVVAVAAFDEVAECVYSGDGLSLGIFFITGVVSCGGSAAFVQRQTVEGLGADGAGCHILHLYYLGFLYFIGQIAGYTAYRSRCLGSRADADFQGQYSRIRFWRSTLRQ